MNTDFIKNIILIVVIVGAVYLFYSIFVTGDLNSLFLASDERRVEQETVIRELLTLRKDLESLTIDTSFIESDVFRALEDNAVFLSPQPQGRRNPFQPLR